MDNSAKHSGAIKAFMDSSYLNKNIGLGVNLARKVELLEVLIIKDLMGHLMV